MRLQLIILIATLAMFLNLQVHAQGTTEEKLLDDSEINFLFNYYNQDGDNAAVTGGRGTEKLTNIAPSVILTIPLDTNKLLISNLGFDNYSSASTDRIDDPNFENLNLSSASSKDTRFFYNGSYQRSNMKKKRIDTYKAGVSGEYDYLSLSGGYAWTKLSENENTEITLSGMAYFDTWTLIYPTELRGTIASGQEKKRQSFNLNATISQVINKKMQASVSGEFVLQQGRLATPFHRVYFDDGEAYNAPSKIRRIENLPDSRVKIPIGLRLNYYLSDYVVVRSYYRFYYDDFGIIGNTMELETPLKLGPFFVLYPFFRYHTQTAADYFRPFGEHNLNATYYTSDYDLSAIRSYTSGIGFKYSPLYGLARFKGPFSRNSGRITSLKSIEIRYANYQRRGNTDQVGGKLQANSVSFNLTFTY